jgi:hypothetical protein
MRAWAIVVVTASAVSAVIFISARAAKSGTAFPAFFWRFNCFDRSYFHTALMI